MKGSKYIALAGILTLLAMACSRQPSEIHYGSDECAYCKMMITDHRFASQIVTRTGKAIKFDAIECLAAYTGEHKSELESAKLWVSDFSAPGTWVKVGDAEIVRSSVINSPMGASLLGFGSPESAEKHLADYTGERIAWQEIVK